MPKSPLPLKLGLHFLIFLCLSGLFAFSVRSILADWPRVELRSLDHLRPETFKFLVADIDLGRLNMYEVYFNKINDLLGDQVPEVKGLLGYCAFKRGNVTMAIVYYQKAIERNPQFFWYYYNLSAIDLTLGKYNEAFNLLQTALSLDMNQSYGMVLNSRKVYSPILVDYLKDPAQDLIKQFQSGRENAVRMALMAKAGMEGSLDPRVDLKTMFPLMVY